MGMQPEIKPANDLPSNCIQFPVQPSPAQTLVDRLLANASVASDGASALTAHSYRVTQALEPLAPELRFVVDHLFPVLGERPLTHKEIAARLNLCPTEQMEPGLLARFGSRAITEANVRELEAVALQALRPRPMPKPLTDDSRPRLRLVAA